MYRQFHTHFWIDKDIRPLKRDEKYLAAYLFTNPHTHLSGFYYLPIATAEMETDLKRKVIFEALDTLSRIGFAHYDDAHQVVFVVNMKHYQGRGAKNDRASAKQLETLAHSRLLKAFLMRYPAVREYVSDRVSRKEQEQEQEKEQEYVQSAPQTARSTSKSKAKAELSPAFLDWWSRWFYTPVREIVGGASAGARQDAWAEWPKDVADEDDPKLERINRATQAFLTDRRKTGTKIPNGNRFLKKHLDEWLDKQPARPKPTSSTSECETTGCSKPATFLERWCEDCYAENT